MKGFLLENARLISSDEIVPGSAVIVRDGKICEIFKDETPENTGDLKHIDLKNNYLSPGFIDTHLHGCLDHDFLDCSKEEFYEMEGFLASRGVTSFLPSLSSEHHEVLMERIKFLSDVCDTEDQASTCLGIHLEGPYVSPEKRGSHLLECVRNPIMGELDEFIEAGSGWIKRVTIAPELEGALEMIEYLLSKEISVSIGHTNATYEEAKAAFEIGVNHVTHFYNGMAGFHHRNPSIAEAALLDEDVSVELTLDGYHVHPASAQLLYKIKGYRSIILESDANQAAGMPPGEYIRPGNRKIYVKDGCARLENGRIAGSVIMLDDAVRNVRRIFNQGFVEAITMASENPAKSLNISDVKGKINNGFDADMVIFNDNVEILMTINNGSITFRKENGV